MIQQHCLLARAKRISSKAPKRLRDKSGKLYDSEEGMADIACEHFEGIGMRKGKTINREMTKRDRKVNKA